MSDEHVEYSEESWFDRIKESIKGVVVGLLLIVIAVPMLIWNEGRAVKRAEDLEVGQGAVVSVDADKVAAANDGKLVHLSGKAIGDAPLTDKTFGVTTPALKLERHVEMYQWVETKKKKSKKKAGGKKVTKTTYSYATKWTDKAINSNKFKVRKRHTNPVKMPYEDKTYKAKVSVGAFTLSPSAVGKIGGAKTLKLDDKNTATLHKMYSHLAISDGHAYLSGDPTKPVVGDVRISYEIVPSQVITVVAAQEGHTLVPYKSKKLNDSIELVSTGKLSAKKMFAQAAAANATMTWILRFLGFLMNFAGLVMLFKPLSVVADVLPLAGDIVEAGSKLIAGLGSAGLSTVSIAIGWLFYRPLIGIPFLLLGIGLIVAVVMKLRNSRAQRTQPAM